MKFCTRCKATEITQNKSWCRACTKEYNSQQWFNNKAKRTVENKLWRENNKGRYKELKYNYYKSDRGRIVELYRAAKRRAKEKYIAFDLSTDFITEMWNKQENKCALTGIKFNIPQKRTNGKASPFAPSIDRIDCSKGYTKDNVRLVCVAVNYALNEFGEETFKQICQAYLNQISNN